MFPNQVEYFDPFKEAHVGGRSPRWTKETINRKTIMWTLTQHSNGPFFKSFASAMLSITLHLNFSFCSMFVNDEVSESDKFYTTLPRPLKLLFALYNMMVSKSEMLCYFVIILNHIVSASFLSLILPVLIFLWAMLSVPRPTKRFWMTAIIYTEVTISLKQTNKKIDLISISIISPLFVSADCCSEVLFPVWFLPMDHLCLPRHKRWAALCPAQHHRGGEERWLRPLRSHSAAGSVLPPIHPEGKTTSKMKLKAELGSAGRFNLHLWLHSAMGCGTTKKSRCPISSRSWRKKWTRRRWQGLIRRVAKTNLHAGWSSSLSRPPPPPCSADRSGTNQKTQGVSFHLALLPCSGRGFVIF